MTLDKGQGWVLGGYMLNGRHNATPLHVATVQLSLNFKNTHMRYYTRTTRTAKNLWRLFASAQEIDDI